jgi:hypothetical protein
MNRARVLVVLVSVVLAGCTAPVADGPGSDARPDPPQDVEGWENGYWYDESIAVDESDGLDDREQAALIARAMARVEEVRGIEFDRDVPVRIVTREEYRDSVTGGSSGGSDPSGEALFQESKHEALFLVGSSEDATERERENDAQAVQGYYDVGEGEIVIVADGETPTIDEVTLAQELFHAYQFRHLIPDRLPAGATEDTVTAWIAVIEGDANLVDRIYERHCRADWDCVRESPGRPGTDDDGDASDGGEDAGQENRSIHMGIYLLQYFPYAEGEAYVRQVRADGGWEAVDALYEDMPNSTAAIIDGSSHAPRTVGLEDRSAPAWERVERDRGRESGTVGQYGIATMFAYTIYDDRNESLVEREQFLNLDDDGRVNQTAPLDYGLEPALGWDGDRLYAYRSNDGRTGYVWQVAWEDERHAEQFRNAYLELLSYRGASATDRDGVYRIDSGPFAGSYYVRQQGETVTIVSGPDYEALEAIHSLPGSFRGDRGRTTAPARAAGLDPTGEGGKRFYRISHTC